MKHSITTTRHKMNCACALLVCLLLQVSQKSSAQQLAFPGAEGFGKYAVGGRTGSVYHVTNLNDAGAGSLRDAVSAPNRIVVFDVAGVIKIVARMVVSANIYLAGQTSPGEGITVYGNGWSFSGASNTICRYIKMRMGAVGTSGKDANGLENGHDVIWDHCSVSWGRDENFSINTTTATNITIQNCMISQGLQTHSAGGLIQCDGGVTLYRNLYADNGTRNNKVKGVNQYVNNMVYNWSAGAYIMGGDSEGESFANAVGNCFIQGPVDGVRPFSVGNNKFHIYELDNIQDSNRNGVFDPVQIQHSEFGGGPDFQAVPYNYPVLPTIPANTLKDVNLPIVGASLPYRDYADYFVVNEVKSFGKKGALIGNESVLPFGVPTTWPLWAGTVRPDADNDGMPDAWENANGLNPNSAADAMIITGNGYTNIENYINGIDGSYSQPYLRAPINLRADSATQSSISFSWFDYTEKELGFIFERKIDGVFVVLDSTGVNENYYTLTGLQPEEKDTFRVRAYNALGNSGYSNELIAKSKPIEVPVLDPLTFVPDLTWTGAANLNWDLSSINWTNNGTPVAFTDSSKLLFPESVNPVIVNLTAQMGPKDILVNSPSDYTFSGAGFIAGSGSMNKTGAGKLSLLTNNNYTGATVLRNGTLEINKLANGGLPSAIGASANYGFNWVWKGGIFSYTGANTATDRNAIIDETTEFNVSNPAATVTLTGSMSGAGGFTKSGPGKVILKSVNPYEGETIIKGGVIEVAPVSSAVLENNIINNNVGVGTSNILRLQGGTYRTTGGSTTDYENYPFEIYVKDSTDNGIEPYRNANLNFNVHGNGKLTYAIPYLRELIQGDWSDFTGTLVANGVNTVDGSIFMIDNSTGMPNARVITAGNTKIASYSNNRNISFGGLSGPTGTMLSCGGQKTISFGFGYTTYSIGGAGTDETFSGVINNQLYGTTTNTDGETTIIKEGNGVWRLTGTNTYAGTTTITGGALIVNGSNTGTGKTTVVSGILAGKGNISGDVEVQAGTLQPGDSSIGTLALKAKLTLQPASIVNIQINKNTNTYDKVSVLGAVAYNGTLQLDTTGSFALGDIFKIFVTSSTFSGDITQFIPATPGPGMLWKFKPSTGELLVVNPGFVEAPSNLILTAATDVLLGTSSVTATWTDNSDNELNFVLEQSLDSLSFTDTAHTAANAVTYTVNGQTPATKYYYRIKAVGTTRESLYSAIKSVTTPALITPPAVPSNPNPANNQQDVVAASGNLTLSWAGSSNTDTYAVYFGTSAGTLTKQADLPYSATPSYGVSGLTDYTQYFWRIDATNGQGTTTGTVWNFRTAFASPITGDFRAVKTGYYDSVKVSTGIADVWETFDGSDWVPATSAPSGSVNTVTIKNGFTVLLRGTTSIKNLVVETGATLKSLTSARNMRIINSVVNNGTIGSSSTSGERVNFEGYLANGTITLTGNGTGKYYLLNFTCNLLAQTLEVIIDADLNMTGYMRGNYSNATSGTAPVGQNDDNVTITIASGRTVTMGSSSYLQEGSSPTTNTVVEFGNYTYNINGLLDMRTSGTSCIIAHATNPNSTITVNVNGTWWTGNAMRFAANNAAVAGKMFANIGTNGVVDAAIRGATTTNMVFYNASNTQYFYNITGDGVLKNRVGTSELLFPIGSNGSYSPAKLTNTGTADIIAVGVKNTFDNPVMDPSRAVNKQFTITPTTANVVNLAIALGWLPADQAAGFSTASSIVLGHFGTGAWDETAAVFSGSGTISSPYFAKASGFTSFSPFIVANTGGALPLDLLSFSASYNGKKVDLLWSSAREVNVKEFTIERSNNGTSFAPIGVVIATNAAGYSFADANPLSGVSYYRLKIADKDGSYKYSRIVTINTRLLHTVSIFPNPASNGITVTHNAVSNTATMGIYALDGKLLKAIPMAAGSTQTDIAIGQLAAGYYLVTIKDGATSSKLFLKQ